LPHVSDVITKDKIRGALYCAAAVMWGRKCCKLPSVAGIHKQLTRLFAAIGSHISTGTYCIKGKSHML
jgi:hypothetical protein